MQAGSRLEILKDITLELAAGQTLAVKGQSGSGKSTLLSLIAGLDRPTSGTVEVVGKDIGRLSEKELSIFRRDHLGIVFQSFHLISNLTALENISLPLEIAGQKEATARAFIALKEVGLELRGEHFPRQLSGGECQRVAIARAYVTLPALLIADEPSGNLDPVTGVQVMDLLFDLVKRKNMTLLLVTHNESLARRCDRQVTLVGGSLL